VGKSTVLLRQVDILMGLKPINLNGSLIYPAYLDVEAQESLVEDLRKIASVAPFRQFDTRSGRKIGVRMTSAGDYGWFSDHKGYWYEKKQPDGAAWPEIPLSLLQIWQDLAGVDRAPQCCLVNFYGENVKMGLHQDKDERDFLLPILSISLGDDALFRVGGKNRSDPTGSVWIKSGDIALLTGPSRLAYHGIDKTRFASSSLLKNKGRLNVTLRVVD